MSQLPQKVLDQEAYWKLKLLKGAIYTVLCGSILSIILWIKRMGRIDLGAGMGITFALVVLVTLHPSFSWRTKAIALVLDLTLIGLYFPIQAGVRYTALSIASAGVIIAATFFGRRPAFLLIAFDAIVILLYGYGASAGWIHPPDLAVPGESIFLSWLRTAIVFVTVCSMLSLIISGLVDSLKANVDRLERLSEVSGVNEAKYRQLIDFAPEAIVVFDLDSGKFIDANTRAQNLFGFDRNALMNLGPVDLSPEIQENGRRSVDVAGEYLARAAAGEIPVFEWLHKNSDGEIIPCEVRLLLLPDKDGAKLRGSITDIRERRKAQALIQSLALYDNLTGLPNRKLFQDRLQHAIAASERDRQYSALFFIDVDNFKNINDASGHAAGDYYLTLVAERIGTCLKETDTVARWGGDEFVVIAENLSGSLSEAGKRAELIAENMLKAVCEPAANPYARGQYYQNSISIGITLFYGHIHTADELLKRADIAMYQAKLAGKNRLRNFDIEMQKSVEERLAIESDLRRAITEKQFVLAYQPQWNSAGKVIGAEVLLRWQHPERGFVLPGEFIGIAEETGDIIEIGKWVISEVCAWLRSWESDPVLKDIHLAINVSPRQFRDAGFVPFVEEVLKYTGVNPEYLTFELTESLMLESVAETVQKMEDIRRLGVRFSLDDFGTGYSSLTYLKRLPLSELKIDQTFVQEMTTDKNDAALIRTIIGMAENLGLHVLAEGVETRSQLDALLAMGCDSYQGYLFSKPLPRIEFEAIASGDAGAALRAAIFG